MSGEQLQRLAIAIAIALYQDSDLIIFDEFLNAFDSSNENLILQILIKLKIEKTIILISHKENSLTHYD